MKKLDSNRYKMPGKGAVKSMASLAPQNALKTQRERESTMLSARKELADEVRQEQEHIQKALTSSSYLSECMKNIFTLPHEKAEADKIPEKLPTGNKITIKQVTLNSNDLDKIAVSFIALLYANLEREENVHDRT